MPSLINMFSFNMFACFVRPAIDSEVGTALGSTLDLALPDDFVAKTLFGKRGTFFCFLFRILTKEPLTTS